MTSYLSARLRILNPGSSNMVSTLPVTHISVSIEQYKYFDFTFWSLRPASVPKCSVVYIFDSIFSDMLCLNTFDFNYEGLLKLVDIAER